MAAPATTRIPTVIAPPGGLGRGRHAHSRHTDEFDLAVLSVTKLCAILGFTEEWLRASLDSSLSLFERTLQRAVRDIEDGPCLTRRRPFP